MHIIISRRLKKNCDEKSIREDRAVVLWCNFKIFRHNNSSEFHIPSMPFLYLHLNKIVVRSSRFGTRTRIFRSMTSGAITTPNSTYDYDILISGGGVVGASLCASLLSNESMKGLKIGIVDLKAPKLSLETQNQEKPHLQVYALSPATISFLKKVGAWSGIEKRSQSYNEMQVWEEGGPGFLKFSSSDMGIEELGRICENDTILSSLYDSIERMSSQPTFHFGSMISNLSVESDNTHGHKLAKVTLQEGSGGPTRVVTTRLLVGADGAMSTVRKLAGITTWGWSYSHHALVATVKTNSAVNSTAWQRYLTTGPLALLPLWDGYCSIVWSTSLSEAKRLQDLPNDEFLEQLNLALSSSSKTDRWSVFSSEDANGLSKGLLRRIKQESAAVRK